MSTYVKPTGASLPPKSLIQWRPQRDSNPRLRRERAGVTPTKSRTYAPPSAIRVLSRPIYRPHIGQLSAT